jgi:hypothetical protein
MSDNVCISELATRPLLYTDTIGGKQISGDEYWAVTTNELNALQRELAEAKAENERLPAFLDRVHAWMLETFDMETVRNKTERNHRFLEESLELVQSLGCTQAEAHMLVDYVFGRPVGEPHQELGGVMVTIAALCNANDMDHEKAGADELTRCWQNVEKIRAKQAGKPRNSPLPGPSAQTGGD